MSTQRPDAKRIYPKVRYCKPCATKRGACVLYGRMVMVETSVSESCEYENKYYNICSELLNLVSVAKVSAPLVFAERKEYNKQRSFGGSVKSL